MSEWYGTRKPLRVLTDLAQVSKSYVIDKPLDWGKSYLQSEEMEFIIDEHPTRNTAPGRCNSLSEILLEPPVVHMVPKYRPSTPTCESPVPRSNPRWSVRCNLHGSPVPIEPLPPSWHPDPEGITPLSRAKHELPRPYVWPSGTPPRFTPDPSKPCRERDCPLKNLVTAHNQGPYCHNGIPRVRARGPIFGLSNPPPEIWDAYGRLCANRGLGGLKADEDLVVPFAYFHAGNLGELSPTTLDFLYGDSSQNECTEAFLEGLGLVTAKDPGKRPSLLRVLPK